MKKRKIARAAVAVLSIMTIGAGLTALTACDGCNDEHVHKYGDWTISTKPTLDDGGLAEHYCEAGDGGVETQKLPKLTDATFWTEGAGVDPSCTTDGERSFSSEYGTVTVTVPKDPTAHVGGSWTITKDPTATEGGRATHSCEGAVDIPALSDTTVWEENADEYVPATHLTDGKRVYNSVYGKVTVVLPADENAHTYGEWSFVEGKKPTQDAAGEIQRVCGGNDEHIEKKPVPALYDTDFWTYDVSVTPNHQTAGAAKYTNADYELEVEVVLPKIAHSFGKWTITKEPTADATGVATRTCTLAGCASDETATETFTLPVLTNEQFWTRSDFVADYNRGAGSTYTNETYGSVTVYTGAKLVAPYDNKSYYSIDLEVIDGSVTKHQSWTDHVLRVDEKGVGYGTGYPFQGKFVLEMVDAETGLVKVTSYGINDSSDTGYEETANTPYYAYVDFETGIFVLQAHYSWSRVSVAIPSDIPVVGNDFTASACAGDLIVSYKDTDILVTPERTYFGVSVKDIGNEAVDIENILNSSMSVVIRGRDGKVIKAYGQNVENEWVAADEVIGSYNNGNGIIITVKGAGVLNAYLDGNNVTGAYNIVSDNVIGSILDGVYYEFTLSGDGLTPNGGICRVATPKVTLTYDLNGETVTNDIETESEISKYVPVTLAVPEHATKQFVGWFTDAACTVPAALTDGKYIPAEDVTLYAKWAVRVEIPLHGLLEADADKATLVLGEGEVISEKLTSLYKQFDLNENSTKYFDGWYVDEKFERKLPEAAPAKESDHLQLYAKWVDVHALYGEYSGKQLLSGDAYKEATVKVTVDGNISGTLNGKAIAGKINFADGKYTWRATDGTRDNTLWFDADSGLLVIPDEFSKTEMDQYPFILSRNSVIGANISLDYALQGNKTGKTKIVGYGDKLALLFNDTIFGDVTLLNAFGDSLAFDNVRNSKTLVVKQDTATVLAIGTTAEKFGVSYDELGSIAVVSALDGHQGKYNIGGTEYRLDGIGTIIWTESGKDKTGAYTLTSEAGAATKVFDVYVRELVITDDGTGSGGWNGEYGDGEGYSARATVKTYKNTEYYVLTLGATAAESSFVKPCATLEYYSGSELSSAQVNIKIAFPLPELAATEAKVFRGWYEKADFSGNAITEITFNAATDVKTLYAKWVDKVTLTINYNVDGVNPESVAYAKGEKASITLPENIGYEFAGWYKDAAFVDEWDPETELTADTEIFAKWNEASFTLTVHYNDGVSEDKSRTYLKSDNIDFDWFAPENIYVNGKLFSGWYKDEACEQPVDFKNILADTHVYAKWEDHAIYDIEKEYTNSSYTYGFKEENGWYESTNYNIGNTSARMAVLAYVPGKITFQYQVSSESGSYDYLSIETVIGSTTKQLKQASGANGIADKGSPLDTGWIDFSVEVTGKEALCFRYIKDGSVNNGADKAWIRNITFIPYDFSIEGDYTCDGQNNINLDGKGTITFGDLSGTYEVIEGAENTYNVFFKENGVNVSHFTLVIDKEDGTYTLTAEKVTLTYNLGGYGENYSVEVFSEVEIALPMLTTEDGSMVIKGWYISDRTNLILNVTPTEDITLNAEWLVPHALMGTYKGYEVDTYYLRSSLWSITIDAFGNITGSITGSITDYNEETGTFVIVNSNSIGQTLHRYSYYDSLNKTIVTNYSGTSAASTSLSDDIFVIVNVENEDISVISPYVKPNTADYALWDKFNKLFKLTIEDTDKYFFVSNNKVYGNVSIKMDEDIVTDLTTLTTGLFAIYNSENELIERYVYNGSTFVTLDGTQGQYTGALGLIVSNGYGDITIGNDTVEYSLEGDNLRFVLNNAMRLIVLGDGVYEQIQDGYEGEYTLPDDAGIIILDGFGGAGNGRTYVVVADKITIFDGEISSQYGIDIENKQLIGKSIFAGLNFKNSASTQWSIHSLTFDDSSEISGSYYYDSSTSWILNSGTYDSNTRRLTLTVSSQSGNYAEVGDTVVFEYDEVNKKLIFKRSESNLHYNTNIMDLSDIKMSEGQEFVLVA